MLSRNIFFYEKLNLEDNFETRIYLMFTHFSIMLKVSKNKGIKFDQTSYDLLFHSVIFIGWQSLIILLLLDIGGFE